MLPHWSDALLYLLHLDVENSYRNVTMEATPNKRDMLPFVDESAS